MLDMDACPTCGEGNNNKSTSSSHKTYGKKVNPNITESLLRQAVENPNLAITCFGCGALYPQGLNMCPKCGARNNGGYVESVVADSLIMEHKYANVNLTKCSACNSQISTKAETCPHCGNPTGVHVCPKCSSVNTKVITGTSKAASVFLWGAFAANKVMSKFECKDCGHKF